MKSKLLFVISILFFVTACSHIEVVTKKNDINIRNHPDGISLIELKNGRIINFDKKSKISYQLYAASLVILENSIIKEEILFNDIKKYQVISKEKRNDNSLHNGFFAGGLLGFISVVAIVILFILNPIRRFT